MVLRELGSLLHHCAKTKAFFNGLSLHAAAIKTGMDSDTFIGNHILNFYAKCGYIYYAHKVFDKMLDRNLVTWSTMVSGYDQSNRPDLALQVFSQMLKHFKPNEFVFGSALSSCSEVRELKLGRQIHAQALKLGHVSVSFALNSLILMYMKCGMPCDALMIFTDSDSSLLTLVSYNVAITGLVENDKQELGIEVFKIMRQRGLFPDRFTYSGLLGPGEPMYNLSVGMQLHCLMVKLGHDCKTFPGNLLIKFYSKFNLIEESEKVFRSINERDSISWNTIIAACCHCEDYSNSLSLFREMVKDRKTRPDDFVYASVLSAAADLTSMRFMLI
ncbi:hypothetical protein RD792_014371 [Penstemon davidsonii]|uniref:Pentatricopeptide repeat-containing protein n=1 Tax=Penstemon davidsonii TaxID=160366 RepID=A0ABR0CPP0_9LAMI|nr:hypothetical protein RD792_014371 [Penstemon davidsonii]